jgi:hypothetical protein
MSYSHTSNKLAEVRIQESEFRRNSILTPGFCILNSPFQKYLHNSNSLVGSQNFSWKLMI